MRQDLRIVRGTTNMFGIRVTDKDGKEFTLEADQSLVFGLKRGRLDVDRVIIKEINHKADGMYYLELSPADTCDLECGKYYYDVGLQHGNSVFYNVIELSEFIIEPNATKCGDCS